MISNQPTHRSRLRSLSLGFAAALWLAAGGPPALATTINVTTTADEDNTDGDCSLREAILAANSNTAKDACPAGEAAATDTIVLADGGLYALSIPGSDSTGHLGDLNIANNTASLDLVIQVAGGGHATIAQDPSFGEHIFDLAAPAAMRVEDVTLTGGRTAAGVSGGVVFLFQGASLTLRRCVVTGNRAANVGGAIFAAGNLVVENTVFSKNAAKFGGGAISLTSSGSGTISGSVFFDNDGGALGTGGAISNSGTLTIGTTTFLDNRALFGGGAISSDVGLSSNSNCFLGNSSPAVDNFGASPVNAVASWWGSKDGPSGAAPGHGDAVSALVDVTGVLKTLPAGCLPAELVADGGFQIDAFPDGVPDRWVASNFAPSGDGTVCKPNGKCTVKLTGSGVKKSLLQTIRVTGSAGDSIDFSARSKAVDVPADAGAYRARVTFFRADGSSESFDADFAPGTHGFQKSVVHLNPTQNFTKARVRIDYEKASGRAIFDDVSLVVLP